MRLIALALLLIPLAACATPRVVQPLPIAPADVRLATAALEPGNATIKGSALLRQQGGGIVTCAGNPVVLVPATASGSESLVRFFGGDRGLLDTRDDDSFVLPEPNRVALCNAQGFFTFDKVRAGRWHVLTAVTWAAGYSAQGGTLLATTEVPESGEVEVVLTY